MRLKSGFRLNHGYRLIVRRAAIFVGLALALVTTITASLVYSARTVFENCKTGQSVLVRPAATLWYNRPSTAIHQGRLYLSYVSGRTPFGDNEDIRWWYYIGPMLEKLLVSSGSYAAGVSSFDATGRNRENSRLREWHTPDDHGAPALLSHNSGLIAAYSHHSSPLFVRTGGPQWRNERIIDSAAVTYPRLTADGNRIFLIYARGHADGDTGRDLVFRTSVDGGNSWSRYRTMVRAEPGHFIYATQAVVDGANICVGYTIYRSDTARSGSRKDLRLACSNAAGVTKDRSVFSGTGKIDLLVFDLAIDRGRA